MSVNAPNAPLVWSYERSWLPEAISVSSARDFVEALLRQYEMTAFLDNAVLVVSELATNAILHARTPFSVTLERSDGVVLLSVHDESLQLPQLTVASLLALGGRGLRMVQLFSDDWGVSADDGGKSVWASFAHEVRVAQ